MSPRRSDTRNESVISALDRRGTTRTLPLPTLLLPDGVMVAQVTLTHLVMVRIHAGQPFDARCDAPLAHGLRPPCTNEMNALIAEARRMALSKGQRPASKRTCVVYFLRLHSVARYIGASEDVEPGLDDHLSGQACRTTRIPEI